MMQLTLVEMQGWQKRILIESAVTRIGSYPVSDIQLSSEKIAPVHLQIFYLKDQPSYCKVVNVSSTPVEVHGRTSGVLAPLGHTNLKDGDEISLGEYRIIFHLPLVSYVGRESKSIKASLLLPDTVLPANSVMEAQLYVGNSGLKDDCQFQVELSGLPEDCYHIDPIPLMYSGAQEKVAIRLYHRKSRPKAGPLEFELKITSPDSYPGEEFVLRQGFYISPVFDHDLAFEADFVNDAVPADQVDRDQQEMNVIQLDEGVSTPMLDMGFDEPIHSRSGSTRDGLDDPVDDPPQGTTSEPVDENLADVDAQNEAESASSRLRVISNQFDDFWEDED